MSRSATRPPFSKPRFFLADRRNRRPCQEFQRLSNPGGGFQLTPFYDVLTAQPPFDARQIPHGKYKLAMSIGKRPRYRILDIAGRHFVETGKRAGIGPTIMKQVITDVLDNADKAPARALGQMPDDFHGAVHDSVTAAIAGRLRLLEPALAEL